MPELISRRLLLVIAATFAAALAVAYGVSSSGKAAEPVSSIGSRAVPLDVGEAVPAAAGLPQTARLPAMARRPAPPPAEPAEPVESPPDEEPVEPVEPDPFVEPAPQEPAPQPPPPPEPPVEFDDSG